MKPRLLIALFLCALLWYTYGNGLMPLLPVYMTQLGADPALAGSYLAFCFLALAAGTVTAGWLSDRLQHRREWLAICAALAVPMSLALRDATAVWQVALLTIGVWFLGGLSLTLINIIAGLFSGQVERGRVFGILAAANSLASLLGGLSMGRIADRWGYPALFGLLALWIIPVLFLDAFFVQDQAVPSATKNRQGGAAERLPSALYLLLVACLAGGLATNMGSLGRSLAMKQMGFHSSAISSTVAVIGLVTLPLAPLLGRLSDRIGRRPLLLLGFLVGSAGLVLFSVATALWQFQAAAALMAVTGTATMSAAPAFVADLVPARSLGRGISLYSAANWGSGALGFVLMGQAYQALGGRAAFTLAALLSILAIVALFAMRAEARAYARPLH